MLQPIKKSLENEKLNLINTLCSFLEQLNSFELFDEDYYCGRPRFNFVDVLKCLLIMNYHSWSYRRSMSDLKILHEHQVIENIPGRSTLNKYMQEPLLKRVLQKLIEFSALSFVDVEECFMVDSTQFFDKRLMGGSNTKRYTGKGKLFKVPPLKKTNKLSIMIGSNSKIITSAITSPGSVHDYKFIFDLINSTMKSGFKIKTLLGDCAYNSKELYSFCEDKQIDAFLDFNKRHTVRRSKGNLRKQKLTLYRENNEIWYKTYRFRVLIEGVMSSLKRKAYHTLRSRTDNAKECEMLLKALWYNLCIVSKFMDNK